MQNPRQSLQAKSLPFQRCENSYVLTAEEASKIKIIRANEDKDGFQRKKREAKIRDIQRDLREGKSKPYPPVYCGLVNGELLSVDGQHRIEAHVKENRSVTVYIQPMTLDEARETFKRDNGSATRLSRLNMIEAGGCEKSDFLYSLVEAYDVSISQATAFMSELCGKEGLKDFSRDAVFTKVEEEIAQAVFTIWTKHPLWQQIEKSIKVQRIAGKIQVYDSHQAYSSKTVLGALGRLARKNKDSLYKIRKITKAVQQGDWKKVSQSSLRQVAAQTGSHGSLTMTNWIKANILAQMI